MAAAVGTVPVSGIVGKASILATIEPFVGSLIGVVIFHETFTVPKVAGMVLIVAAIVYLNLEINQIPS